ncbi:MAG: right-handed parallel beta-helix repeat-containing protein, partial [Phaeodactylibacter sp.]|nr:right-handed parallel beta-helix repeat-containing protein [Phaeodactylibacter sp.]
MDTLKIWTFLFLCVLSGIAAQAQTIRYVKPVAAGSGDGSSWANASAGLQAMINASAAGDEVWVAAGTYKPTAGTDRTISFNMKDGVAIYGGFPATGTPGMGDRDWTAQETILSGDIGVVGDASDNSYHVVYNLNLNNTAVLDGFTISGGKTESFTSFDLRACGGGMLNNTASPSLSNCHFTGNSAVQRGGGIYNYNFSSPVLNHCSLSGNTAGGGGGMYNDDSSPVLTNCVFSYNHSTGLGGGLSNGNSSPQLVNCDFIGNSAAVGGGGVYNVFISFPTLTDCTFSQNSAEEGGGIFISDNSLTLLRCSFSGNSANKGGGIANFGGAASLTACTFSGNTATASGGGIHNAIGGSVSLMECSFSGNSASSGGGLYNQNTSTTSYLENCIFSGNSASGGGIFSMFSASAELYNCTLYGNTSGIRTIAPGFANLTNCILWNNTQEIITDNPSTTAAYSIIQGGYPGPGNIDIDPLFVSPTDLRLQACSPAIDAGANAGAPAADYDGNPRPFNSFGTPVAMADMGAFEYQQAQTPTVTPSVTISGPTGINCQGGAYTASPVNGGPAPSYNWMVNGVAVGAHTATFTTTNLVVGDVVSCEMASSEPCAYPVIATSNSIAIAQETPLPGNPAEFGDNEWRVYAWNAGGATPISDYWNSDYSGYYTSTDLNFNTQDQWNSLASPSSAPGYQGCPVVNDNHSWSAKRTGFTCGYYRLSVDSHDDAAQLWIDGVMAWEHIGCCDSHANVWEGFLNADSEVEFRVTEGGGASHGALSFQQATVQITQTGSLCGSGSATLALPNNPAGDYLWSTGETASSITVTEAGAYSATVTDSDGCSISASTYVIGVVGDPAVFGDNVWNVYAWNAGGESNTGNSWNTDYAGYYTNTNLNFSSTSHWPASSSPSSASGYQGCSVNADNHSWSAKRRGFPCDYYQINVTSHDDYAQLWVDGVMVWDAPGVSNGAWTGFLDPNSEVEFRVTEGYGNSNGSIVLQPFSPSLTGLNGLCSASPATLAVQGNPAGNYLWPTGETTPSILITEPGTYSVTIDNGNGCSASTSGTAIIPVGDPAEFGDNAWKVHAWNAGGQADTGDSWNTNYAGYYTVNSLNFNSQDQWHTLASPSSAPGYQGCPVDNDNHSFSAKRRGFPCGFYSINIDGHDDAAQLWINGVMVWEFVDCCQSHTGVWVGELGPDDEVEFRVTEGVGISSGVISFQNYLVQLTGTFNVCYGASDGTVSASGFPGATYSWSNGEQTATISDLAAGEYCVTVSTSGGCGAAASQCFTINSYPQLPPLSIVPDGPTTACPGTEVELCSSAASLPDFMFIAQSNGILKKFNTDLTTHALTEAESYSFIWTSNALARHPATKEIFVVAPSAGIRTLYTFNLQTNAV